MLVRVLRPVYSDAVSLGTALEHFKVMRKVGKGMLLDLRGQITQLLPFGYAPGASSRFVRSIHNSWSRRCS